MDALAAVLARKRKREAALVPTPIVEAPIEPAEPTVVNGYKRVSWSGETRSVKYQNGKRIVSTRHVIVSRVKNDGISLN